MATAQLHFSRKELAERRQCALTALAETGCDGLLMFRQESMYYLSGYDTFGYVFFQCLYLHNDGRMALLTRAPDLRQAQLTSVITDIRIWEDASDANPADTLRDIVREYAPDAKTLAVEWDAYGLTAQNGRRLAAAFADCELRDASSLVSRLRVVKSEAEIAHVRRAAALADDALAAAQELARPNAYEGDILAAMQAAVFKGGGEYSGNEFIIGSGERALLCRSYAGRRRLSENDQLTLEFAGAYCHYHAALMRTLVIGKPRPQHEKMRAVCHEAATAAKTALCPGQPIGEVFDAYASVADKNGMKKHRLNATGYSMGATFAPNWMDWPMFYHGNSVIAVPNMIFFLHIILMDSETETAMTTGETLLVTVHGCERLSKAP